MAGEKKRVILEIDSQEDYYRKRGILSFKWPIRSGVVENFDDWEKIFHILFYDELRVAPEEQGLTVVVDPRAQLVLSKMIQIFFETFNVPILLPIFSDVATLHAASLFENKNLMTGLVLNCGETTVVSCVIDGLPLHHSIESFPVGAPDVDSKLASFPSKLIEQLREVIRSNWMFVVPCDFETFLSQAKLKKNRTLIEKEVEIPGLDEIVVLYEELFVPTEELFTKTSIPAMIARSIEKCPQEYHEQLWNNIVLAGKTTTIPGYSTRLGWELDFIRSNFHIRAYSERGEMAWIGASSLGEILFRDEQLRKRACITLEEYDEDGPDHYARIHVNTYPLLPNFNFN